MKQTKNGSIESPRLAMTAKVLGAITFWTGFPILLAITVLVTQGLLSNPTPIVVIETIVIFCIYLRARAVQDEGNDFFRNQLMCFVTGAVVLRLTYNANYPLNHWGITGWAVLFGVIALVFGLVLPSKRRKHDSWIETLSSFETWMPISVLCLLALGAQQVYLHWATPWVWVALGMIWVFLFTTKNTNCSWVGVNNDHDIPTIWLISVVVIVGLVSFIWQFWHPIVKGLGNISMKTLSLLNVFVNVVIVDFWACWIVVLLVAVGIWSAARQRNIRDKKSEEELAEKRRIEQEEQRKKNDAVRKEREQQQRKDDLRELAILTEKLASNESPNWKDIRRWKSLVSNLGLPANSAVDPHKIMTTPLLPLFVHSKEKNQIAYNGDLLRSIWLLLECTIAECFDDEILSVIKKNLKDLKKFEGTIGYDDMVRYLKYINRVRSFFEDDEREIA